MRTIKSQSGAVLMVSLIILLILTLIGISGARSILMSERMTFASRDAKVALEVAESVARRGEDYIETLTNLDDFGTTGWRRTAGDGPDDLFDGSTWTDTNSVEQEVSMEGVDGEVLTGRMFIELAGLTEDDTNITDVDLSAGSNASDGVNIQVFKIVSRGVGIGGTERIIITLYGKEI
ncbi:PilX N-terminal domain-containing pilus assembly protein [Microbulbifer sp. EKSA005]|uniref:pilus assembly PilX family protein n=1 Tax=Microbulbifer sp. EKSA005 TaxID=3243364 RepID=UPI00404136B0